jgi:hypothetical protein
MREKRIVLLIFIWTLLTLPGWAQNPFDIKVPDKNKKTNQVPKENPKSNRETPTSTIPNQETTKPSTAIQATKPQPTESLTNPFEIKAEDRKSSAPTTNRVPDPAGSQASKPGNETGSSQPQAAPPVSSQAIDAKPNGLNPFNILPGQSAQPSGIQPPPTVQAPSVTELKEQIKDIQITATQSHRTISKNTWFIIFLFLFLLAAVAINFNRSYPVALIKATYNQNQLRILFKDAFKGNHSFIFGIFYFLFIINGGIFLYHSFQLFDVAPISLFQSVGVVFLVYLIRHLILFILATIFPLSKEANLFSYTIGIYNLALGLALMLINIILSFVDPETGKMLIFSGLSLVLALYIMRQIRGFLNNVQTMVSAKFHFIIYLCTVEIAPWLLLSGILIR